MSEVTDQRTTVPSAASVEGPWDVPERIGSYKVEREIGHGGMGIVYLARDERLGRRVAIKALMPGTIHHPTARAFFEREARVLASLNHPGIAAIYHLEHVEDRDYLVLEYVPGQNLDERLRAGPLEVRDALAVAEQIADAVGVAHEKGIIHRDLKPSNIRITPDGRAKVLDFGLARVVAGDGDLVAPRTAATGATTIAGTPGYMSPEQERGEPLDARTDVWSFGCLLYQMLTGRLPFPEKNRGEEPDWASLPDGVSGTVHELLRRCLASDPKERTYTLAVVRCQLAVAHAPVRGSRLWRAAAVLLVVAIGLAGHWSSSPISEPRAAYEAEVEPPSILILPFRVQSDLGAPKVAGRDLAEALAVNLADAPRLSVLPVAEFTGEDPLRQAKRAGADLVLTGSLRSDGSGWQLSMRLLDALEGRLVWSSKKATRGEGLGGAAILAAQEIAGALDAEPD